MRIALERDQSFRLNVTDFARFPESAVMFSGIRTENGISENTAELSNQHATTGYVRKCREGIDRVYPGVIYSLVKPLVRTRYLAKNAIDHLQDEWRLFDMRLARAGKDEGKFYSLMARSAPVFLQTGRCHFESDLGWMVFSEW